ncbi:MFS transporter [Xaviernesmea oryzae]|uniref:MFS transporter n=1 Tax=Xaviernesmea oryzae TaxID=464029 RepID=A0A1Q9B1U2_9HYPH|nr:arsenite efflux MFS transporter ArsK [Xaviernesmea oryzae]OLP61971.1 MFS transporter [Xaviernesmea oryzae]SEK98944.1 Predicted arabinose efflux permease, MFS family [Xaviernesmea oryzae]
MSSSDLPLTRAAQADIAALGVTQVIGYGTLYYSFGTLAPDIARDLGWPKEWVFGALSVALMVGGLVAPMVGRWLDRVGAGRLMAAGSVAAALSLIACALAPSYYVFVPALLAIEIASTFVQYSAAFPLLVQNHPAIAQRCIVYLTLIAGFSSTLFWPLTTWLQSQFDWREIYLLFAGMNLLICLPLHVWLAGRGRPVPALRPQPSEISDALTHGSLPQRDRMKGFLLMVTAFACQSFVNSAVLVLMLPMLSSLQLGAAGVTVSALFGPSQVAVRLINMLFGRQLSQLALAILAATLLPASLLILAATAPAFAGAIVFAVLFGMGNGVQTIVLGTLPLRLFGTQGYGARQGRVMAVRLTIGSAAPFAFSLMTDHAGPREALMAAALIGCGAVASFAAIGWLVRHPTPQPAPAQP